MLTSRSRLPKSEAILSNVGNLTIFFYNLKNIPMNALEAKYYTGWFG